MSSPDFNTAIILAGGKSLRFGRDKAFIPIGDHCLIEHILLQLQKSFSEIIIVANEREKFTHLKVPVVPDLIREAGPLAGIQAGLAASSSPYAFVMACDMPYISLSLIEYMQKRLLETPSSAAVISRQGFIEPFHAFYSRDLLHRIGISLREGKRGINSFLGGVDTLRVGDDTIRALCPDERVFANINYKSDLERLERRE